MKNRTEGCYLDKKTNSEKVALAFESIINFAESAVLTAQKVTVRLFCPYFYEQEANDIGQKSVFLKRKISCKIVPN